MALALVVLIGPGPAGAEGDPSSEAAEFFEKEVRPLLIERCFGCHSASKGAEIKANLRLDHRGGWELGGDSGPALRPGRVEESLLIRAVRYRDPDLQMPPKGKLAGREIAVLERWVAEGAYDPRDEAPSISTADGGAKEASGGVDLEEARSFWAFQPPDDPAVPVDGLPLEWARAPVDAFLLRHWRAHGVEPAPATLSPAAMERRLAGALTGLPPAVLALPREAREVDDARERMIDRLLASPRYGERWGRHWLDVARFADSNGMDENKAYVEAYRYRDYVIDAFNEDLPFDRFVMEQLAGDLVPGSGLREKVATGFLAIGPKMLACDDPRKMRMDIVDEQIDTTGRAFLGMTFGCARCHDHKFDPISIGDYYGLAGIFMSTETLVDYKVVAQWHEYDLSPPEVRDAHKKIAALQKRLKKKSLKEADRKEIEAQLEALTRRTPPRTKVMGVGGNAIENARVHLRGSYLTLGEERSRRVPAVFREGALGEVEDPVAESGRHQLAQWIASKENPLTARVLVNRLWRWHFGKGIVASTDNFGKLGAPPRDPALLDHLAQELMRGDWSIKRLQRLLVTSGRYGLPSVPGPRAVSAGENLDRCLPAYHQRRRLDAESLRDSLLGLSGRLDLAMHGQLSKDEAGKYVDRSRLDRYLEIPRRTVYLPIIRSALYDSLVAFDMADPSMANGDRRESVVAPQALYLMNGRQVLEAAASLAEALPGDEPQRKLDRLYQRVLNRLPSVEESDRAREFLKTYRGERAWEAMARVLFASNEFLYLN